MIQKWRGRIQTWWKGWFLGFRDVGSSRSMIWKRVDRRVLNLEVSPYSKLLTIPPNANSSILRLHRMCRWVRGKYGEIPATEDRYYNPSAGFKLIAISLLTDVSCFTIEDLQNAEIWHLNTPLLQTFDLYGHFWETLPKISRLFSFCMHSAAHHNHICLSCWHSPFPCVDRIRFPALGKTFRSPVTQFSACGAKLRMYRSHRGPTRDQPVPAIKIRIMMKSPGDCSSIHGGTAGREGGKWKVCLSSWGEGRQGPNFQLLPSEFHNRRGS